MKGGEGEQRITAISITASHPNLEISLIAAQGCRRNNGSLNGSNRGPYATHAHDGLTIIPHVTHALNECQTWRNLPGLHAMAFRTGPVLDHCYLFPSALLFSGRAGQVNVITLTENWSFYGRHRFGWIWFEIRIF